MTYQMRVCVTEADFEQYADFMLAHRHHFLPQQSVRMTIDKISSHISRGRAILYHNDKGEVIGTLGLIFGSEDSGFRNKEMVLVDCLVVREDYRGKRLFYRGFCDLVELLAQEPVPVDEIQFDAFTGNPYLRKLYGKFAKVQGLKQVNEEWIDENYSISFDAFSTYIRQFGSKDKEARRS